MTGRKRNPRVLMIQDMRQALKYLRISIRRWSRPPSLHWYDAGDGHGVQYQNTPRIRKDVAASEYRENRPSDLRLLIKCMEAIESYTGSVKTIARQRLAELERGGESL